MLILRQLRFLLLVLLHVSPGKTVDPMLPSELSPLSQAGACTAVSAALQRAQTADATLPPPPSAPRPPATASSWRSTSPTWSVSASLGSTQIYLRSQLSESKHFPDDADANLGDNGAGSLLFMARTCVGENVGDFCSTGVKEGQAVTVCRSVMAGISIWDMIIMPDSHNEFYRQHCDEDGCNSGPRVSGPGLMISIPWILLIRLLGLSRPW